MEVATIPLDEVLSENVRREMTLRGWSQNELAQRAGVSQPRISELFSNRSGVRVTTVEKLAKAFGVQASVLLVPVPDQES